MSDKPLSERIDNWFEETCASPDGGDLRAWASEVTALEARAVPWGWYPVRLRREDGANLWVGPDGWKYEEDIRVYVSRPLPGVDPTDWRGAIAAYEQATGGSHEGAQGPASGDDDT